VLADRLRTASLIEDPWPHLELPQFLDDEDAREIASKWPTTGFSWLRHSDVAQPDGTSLRKIQHLSALFPEIDARIRSDAVKDEFSDALEVDGKLYPICLLVEDLPGYKIRRHTDCAGKVITSQVYLADDESAHDRGVVLQTLDGKNWKRIPYSFNHGYAFKVTRCSWHRVAASSGVRKSLQLIYYDTPTPKL